MTDPCSSCGSSPAISGGLCGRCESAQQWLASDAKTGASSKQLDRAKADLTALPDLVVELARCLTEKPQQQGGGGGKPGSRPPMRLDVLHLVDEREKPLWWGEDPRLEDMGDRYGVLWQLAAWSRVVAEEMPDAPYLADEPTVISEVGYLLAAWDFIAAQGWSDEFCTDVVKLSGQVKSSLGVRQPDRFVCPDCGARATIVAGGYLNCTEGHDTNIRDIEGRLRRRPALPTRDICDEFHVSEAQLWQWKARRKILPVKYEGRGHAWFPWDVFCVLNPDIKTAIDMREAAQAV